MNLHYYPISRGNYDTNTDRGESKDWEQTLPALVEQEFVQYRLRGPLLPDLEGKD